jgi:hypothetical protein
MWQNFPLLQGHGDPLTGIESGRISANRARFEGVFHTKRNGAVYGVSREGAGPEKSNPGQYRACLGYGFFQHHQDPDGAGDGIT